MLLKIHYTALLPPGQFFCQNHIIIEVMRDPLSCPALDLQQEVHLSCMGETRAGPQPGCSVSSAE